MVRSSAYESDGPNDILMCAMFNVVVSKDRLEQNSRAACFTSDVYRRV